MGLLDTISKIFRPAQEPTTTSDEMMAAASESSRGGGGPDPYKLFSVEDSREDRVKASRKMYDQDPRAKRIIQTIARDVTKGGYTLEVDDPKAQEVADAMRQRLRLDARLDDFMRLTLRDGDSFLEIAVTAQREIYEVSRKPSLNMHRNTDKRDKFKDPFRAFWYSDRPWEAAPGDNALWFADWQIVHARWDHDEGSKYGTPLLASARRHWKLLEAGETDIAVRRRVRSGQRHVHQLQNAGPAEIEQYKQTNRAALDDPFNGLQDFFISNGDIKAIQGDANLGEITDVRHHLNTFWFGGLVPMAILGYGQDVDFSVVGHQKEQYDEGVLAGQSWLEAEILVPLLERQWLLAGIPPEMLEYQISWPTKKQTTAADIKAITEAALHLQVLGVPPATIAQVLSRFLNIPADMLMGEEADELATERLANIIGALAGATA